MTPVFQTRRGAAFSKIVKGGTRVVVRGGNCFQAALASVLDVPLDAVPDFVNDLLLDDDWFAKVQRWTREQAKLHVVYVGLSAYYDWDALDRFRPRGWSIVGGKSRRGHDHVCVALDGVVVHDPFLDEDGTPGDGLVAVSGWYVFVPVVEVTG